MLTTGNAAVETGETPQKGNLSKKRRDGKTGLRGKLRLKSKWRRNQEESERRAGGMFFLGAKGRGQGEHEI